MLFKRKPDNQGQKPKAQLFIAVLLILIGLAGLIVATVIYLEQPRPPSAQSVKSVDANIPPSSIKPSAKVIASYNVPPTNPKYISIPAIGISSIPVLKLGLMSNGSIATPDNIYDTGWYDASSLPGQPGAMFIYGHVSSWTADGIFYNLKKLVPGDIVTITRGDNTKYNYSVLSSKIYPYNAVDMSQVLAPINSSNPGLNLMTCTGQVIQGTSEFNKRLVVFTSLVKS